jgi:hypothetical protein
VRSRFFKLRSLLIPDPGLTARGYFFIIKAKAHNKKKLEAGVALMPALAHQK